MRLPVPPPPLDELVRRIMSGEDGLRSIMGAMRPVDDRGRYLHWDDVRHRTPPDGMTREQWWLGMALSRMATSRPLPLLSVDGAPFRFSNVDRIQEAVHRIDQQASGQILSAGQVMNPRSSDRYLVSSLEEEAITSSLLEGATTTRRIGKELLRSGRRPLDRSERMILNNFNAMGAARELAERGGPLTPDAVLELHRIVTAGTLDDEADAGRLQERDDLRVSVTWEPVAGGDLVLHEPPPVAELPGRLANLCRFANEEHGAGFIHPVVRAIVLHFWIAYDHPFADGNGRVARALFYWSMLRAGYWLAQYLSISSILRKAPARYARSYLHVESDGNDMTYFVIHQLHVIERAIEDLRDYLARKVGEMREVEALLHGSALLNHRQIVAVSDVLRGARQEFTIREHAQRHRVVTQSARTDLLGLEALGLFSKRRAGKPFVFTARRDLAERLRAVAAPRA